MKKFLTVIGLVVGGVAALGIVVGGIAVSTGYAYVGFKQPTAVVFTQTQVCKEADIDTYNALVVLFPASQEQQDKKVADFKAFGEDITSRSDFAKDPSCVFMAYSAAIQQRNQIAAGEHLKTLTALSGHGEYPKNTIVDLTGLKSMEDRIKSLQDPSEIEQNPLGSG